MKWVKTIELFLSNNRDVLVFLDILFTIEGLGFDNVSRAALKVNVYTLVEYFRVFFF